MIDVRQHSEYGTGHVPGAINIELGSVAARRLSDGPLTVMCGHGERAMTGASILTGRGHRDVSVLDGGPDTWAEWSGQRWRSADERTHHNAAPLRLGLRENLAQFALLVGVNALVGGMIGQERTVLPLLAGEEFGLTKFTATLTFIAAFGIVKAGTNFFAGTLSDRYGRKPVLVAGWIIGIPVPLLLMWAPTWSWVVFANVLLGVNQGLTWSTTIIMKIDLVGPANADWRWVSTRPPATSPWPPPRSPPATSPNNTGCARHRSSSASPSPGSASASRRCSFARPAATPGTRPPSTSPPTTPSTIS